MIVAIDGPAGSGKSTVARLVATRLGFHYLDTGAMYRSVALAAVNAGLNLDDAAAVSAIAHTVTIGFEHDGDASIPTRITLDGRDVTAAIRTPQIDAAVSAVARLASVREAMVPQQRVIGATDDLVAEGRDIGTVVFPDADVKVFLTASPEERARRRHAELAARGDAIDAAAVHEGLVARDEADSSRETAPLVAAGDAVVLDTTGLTIDQVVEAIATLAQAAR
ncbi:MAG: (d)CMP kinase [Coriobacteriia bacterium]|nr:(d)CMP kinase [Coriobacteriia bacterium]